MQGGGRGEAGKVGFEEEGSVQRRNDGWASELEGMAAGDVQGSQSSAGWSEWSWMRLLSWAALLALPCFCH